jgi:RNA polymerase sigma-70 factor, ECF subfamily
MSSERLPEPDASIVLKAMEGDGGSFEILVQRYENAAFALAFRMCHDRHLAADVTQEIFLQLYRNLKRYDPARPFTPWFFRLATNMAINVLKLRQNRRRKLINDVKDPGGQDPLASVPSKGTDDVGEEVVLNERRQRLRNLIAGLPEKYSAIVALRYLQELGVEEISQSLDMPVGTVKVRLYRARDLLRQRLEQEGLLP